MGRETDGTWTVTVTGLRSEEQVAWSHSYRVDPVGLADAVVEALNDVALRCQTMAMLRAARRS